MNKLQLIEVLKDEFGLSRSESLKVVDTFFNAIAGALSKGDRVEVRGLCSFFNKKYKSYIGRNPKSGEKVNIRPKILPFFKAGKELKDRVDR